MPTVRAREGEPVEITLRKFKRATEKAGILKELRRRAYHEKDTSKRKRNKAAAVKRLAKQVAREKAILEGDVGSSTSSRSRR